MSWIVS